MKALVRSFSELTQEALAGWNRFWFTPQTPYTLAFMRILVGLMLFYTHLVWALDLTSFLGSESWVSRPAWDAVNVDAYVWSYLWLVQSPAILWVLHVVALCVFALLTIGYRARLMAVLAWFIAINYCHRLTGALFGLDQINVMLVMYLMLGENGAAYSVDWFRKLRRSSRPRDSVEPNATVGTNIAIRLIQIHLCLVYFFGGIAKMHGTAWWDGSATWMAVANYEYQSLDMTWLGHYPLLTAFLTHVTMLWEAYYCFLVWPRVTRPVVLFVAVCVHIGIAVSLGMATFGLVMLIANMSFVSPHITRRLVPWWHKAGSSNSPMPGVGTA